MAKKGRKKANGNGAMHARRAVGKHEDAYVHLSKNRVEKFFLFILMALVTTGLATWFYHGITAVENSSCNMGIAVSIMTGLGAMIAMLLTIASGLTLSLTVIAFVADVKLLEVFDL